MVAVAASRMVAVAAANYPKSHRGTTANAIRLYGQKVKKSRDIGRISTYIQDGTTNETCVGFPWYYILKKLFDLVSARMCESKGTELAHAIGAGAGVPAT